MVTHWCLRRNVIDPKIPDVDDDAEKKEGSRGVYGKRTTLYDNYVFDKPKEEDFYDERVTHAVLAAV